MSITKEEFLKKFKNNETVWFFDRWNHKDIFECKILFDNDNKKFSLEAINGKTFWDCVDVEDDFTDIYATLKDYEESTESNLPTIAHYAYLMSECADEKQKKIIHEALSQEFKEKHKDIASKNPKLVNEIKQEIKKRRNIIKNEFQKFAKKIFSLCPDSREKSLAKTKLEECEMWLNRAISDLEKSSLN